METRVIPGLGLEVSCVCLGTMTFGNPIERPDAIRLVHAALDRGVNFIDTADMYEGYDRRPGSPGGVAESILGEALIDRREQAVITTKVGSDVGGKGLGERHIRRQIEASLKRLRTDRVDIYEAHRPDQATPIEETIRVMTSLIEEGKIRCWGVSNFSAKQLASAVDVCDQNGFPRPAVSQPHYNWLHREVEHDHLPLCRELNIALTPYQPFEGGLLTGKYRRRRPAPQGSRAAENPDWLTIVEEQYDRLEQFETEARSSCVSPSVYALRWLLDQPPVASVVVGIRRIEQLSEIAEGLEAMSNESSPSRKSAQRR